MSFGLIRLISKAAVDSLYSHEPLLFHEIHSENILLDSRIEAHKLEDTTRGILFTNRPVNADEKVVIWFNCVDNELPETIACGFTTSNPKFIRNISEFVNNPTPNVLQLKNIGGNTGLLTMCYCNRGDETCLKINDINPSEMFLADKVWGVFYIGGISTKIELISKPKLAGYFETTFSPCDSGIEEIQNAIEFNCQPIHFNDRVHSQNVNLSSDKLIAAQYDFGNGYALLSKPFNFNKCLAVQILNTDSIYIGGLSFGLAKCGPSALDLKDLDEYESPQWFVKRCVGAGCIPNDVLFFWCTRKGDIMMKKKTGGSSEFLFNVKNELILWPVFDIYGSTTKIRVFTFVNKRRISCVDYGRKAQSQQPLVPHIPGDLNDSDEQSEIHDVAEEVREEIDVNSESNSDNNVAEEVPEEIDVNSEPNADNNVVEEVQEEIDVNSESNADNNNHRITEAPRSSTDDANEDSWENISRNYEECTVCYEECANTMLYDCGHMCLCMQCALQLWKGKGDGNCPICRKRIRDVTRVFKA